MKWMKKLASAFLVLTLMTGSLALAEDAEISADELFEDVMLDENGQEPEDAAAAPEDAAAAEGDEFVFGDVESSVLEALDETLDTSVNLDDLELNPNLPSNVVNILLIGIDTKDQGFSAGLHNADAQIILSINKDTGDIKLCSVMRDLYVKIPTRVTKARINTSFAGKTTGGPSLSMRTINNLFEMNIDKYVVINFYGLASVIDAIGGVDLELTKAEARGINNYYAKYKSQITRTYDPTPDKTREKLTEQDGVQHLDGLFALLYARMRKIDSDGDFSRTARQRNLLEQLLKQVMGDMTLDKFITLVETTIPYVQTNVDAATIMDLGMNVLGSGIIERAAAGESLLSQMHIPMDDTWYYGTTESGSSVLMFQTKKCKGQQVNTEGLHEFIYGQYYPAK